jgi:pimeloyl-ACP methyl ester carboxylesterase
MHVGLDAILALATLAVAYVVVWGLLVAFLGVDEKRPPQRHPRPAKDRAEALARFEEFHKRDTADFSEACWSKLLEPDGDAAGTVIYYHGFTNCPAQLRNAAPALAARGYRVLIPRQPRMGRADVLNKDLAGLESSEIIEFSDQVVDIAAGFGSPVYVVGLSTGALLAVWSAATRDEVVRVVSAAPVVAPMGVPFPAVRLLVRFPHLIPGIYNWWNPKLKENLGESPYAYPGFPLASIFRYMYLGVLLRDRTVRCEHELERATLLSNPNDTAVRRDLGLSLVRRTFEGHAAELTEARLGKELEWTHDFVDPASPHGGSGEQAAEVFLAALGLGGGEGMVESAPM